MKISMIFAYNSRNICQIFRKNMLHLQNRVITYPYSDILQFIKHGPLWKNNLTSDFCCGRPQTHNVLNCNHPKESTVAVDVLAYN